MVFPVPCDSELPSLHRRVHIFLEMRLSRTSSRVDLLFFLHHCLVAVPPALVVVNGTARVIFVVKSLPFASGFTELEYLLRTVATLVAAGAVEGLARHPAMQPVPLLLCSASRYLGVQHSSSSSGSTGPLFHCSRYHSVLMQ